MGKHRNPIHTGNHLLAVINRFDCELMGASTYIVVFDLQRSNTLTSLGVAMFNYYCWAQVCFIYLSLSLAFFFSLSFVISDRVGYHIWKVAHHFLASLWILVHSVSLRSIVLNNNYYYYAHMRQNATVTRYSTFMFYFASHDNTTTMTAAAAATATFGSRFSFPSVTHFVFLCAKTIDGWNENFISL